MMKFMRQQQLGLLFFGVIFLLSLFITYKLHSGKGFFNWQSEIWADKAGYYIYLPATFIYGFDVKRCPEKIDEKTGYGFTIDPQKNTINIKYTYGVSTLISPFFITTHFIAKIFHKKEDGGFSRIYHKMVNLCAVVYLMLGLWFLWKFLVNYFKPWICYFVLFFILAGTNLLFYATDETLMSHVYSFFLFALFLFSLRKFLADQQKTWYFILLSFSFAFSVLIRPTNILLILLIPFWDCSSVSDVMERIRQVLKPRNIIIFLVIFILVFLPQLFFWKYSRGSMFAYSYGSESFSNWSHPKLLEVWFSTLNGLFLYNPLVILFVAGMIWMIRKKISNGIFTLFLFLLISYIFASWYNWYFGCSYGQRSYVEYWAIFSIPFGYFVQESSKIRQLLVKSIIFFVIILFSYYNVRMIWGFEKCFFGSTWDWEQFTRQLDKAGIYKPYLKTFSFRNDMENQALSYNYQLTDSIHRSGMYSAKVVPENEFIPVYNKMLTDFWEGIPKSLTVSFWTCHKSKKTSDGILVFSIQKNDSLLVYLGKSLNLSMSDPLKWQQVEYKFLIPDGIPRDATIKCYIWNRSRSDFFIDDIETRFER